MWEEGLARLRPVLLQLQDTVWLDQPPASEPVVVQVILRLAANECVLDKVHPAGGPQGSRRRGVGRLLLFLLLLRHPFSYRLKKSQATRKMVICCRALHAGVGASLR